jgi:secernin
MHMRGFNWLGLLPPLITCSTPISPGGVRFSRANFVHLDCSVSFGNMAAYSRPPPPRSCDTFVALSDEPNGYTVFGKNSDRPNTEVHEVVRFSRGEHLEGSTLKCQYIEIPQVAQTHAVILSRPAWLWGAEMGANEHGVCVGNEAVHSRLASECDDGVSRLLGMDLVRLALERGATAREALDVMTGLLEQYGQGGSCEEDGDWCYENGFLICDVSEAYVLETAGVHYWASELISKGKKRNISNGLSIRKPHSTHAELLDLCKRKNWWDGVSDFDWKAAVGSGGLASANLEPQGREKAGKEWLAKFGSRPSFSDMAACLRDTDSDICMQGYFESTGSQISLLPARPETKPGSVETQPAAVHWFTTGSDPSQTCYKPFAFAASGGVGEPGKPGEEAQLWLAHKKVGGARGVAPKNIREQLFELETQLLDQVEKQGGKVCPEDFLKACAKERQILGVVVE